LLLSFFLSLFLSIYVGKLKGIHGRLGSLGTIDARYDVAISTACPQLNNIVVDTTVNAEQCVEYIRRNRLGVATFLILDKQKRFEDEIRRPFQAPPNSERLFDLVHCGDELYRTAFYFALRDTLVCPELQLANQIAFGKPRRRVVTLAGELIDVAGTMSGGGKSVASGFMKTGSAAVASSSLDGQLSESETSKLEQEVQSLQQQLQQITAQVREMNEGSNVID
jgi:structural maintenance of chromosome 4